jgi:hypothetical protein
MPLGNKPLSALVLSKLYQINKDQLKSLNESKKNARMNINMAKEARTTTTGISTIYSLGKIQIQMN